MRANGAREQDDNDEEAEDEVHRGRVVCTAEMTEEGACGSRACASRVCARPRGAETHARGAAPNAAGMASPLDAMATGGGAGMYTLHVESIARVHPLGKKPAAAATATAVAGRTEGPAVFDTALTVVLQALFDALKRADRKLFDQLIAFLDRKAQDLGYQPSQARGALRGVDATSVQEWRKTLGTQPLCFLLARSRASRSPHYFAFLRHVLATAGFQVGSDVMHVALMQRDEELVQYLARIAHCTQVNPSTLYELAARDDALDFLCQTLRRLVPADLVHVADGIVLSFLEARERAAAHAVAPPLKRLLNLLVRGDHWQPGCFCLCRLLARGHVELVLEMHRAGHVAASALDALLQTAVRLGDVHVIDRLLVECDLHWSERCQRLAVQCHGQAPNFQGTKYGQRLLLSGVPFDEMCDGRFLATRPMQFVLWPTLGLSARRPVAAALAQYAWHDVLQENRALPAPAPPVPVSTPSEGEAPPPSPWDQLASLPCIFAPGCADLEQAHANNSTRGLLVS